MTQEGMHMFKKWLDNNKLSLNLSKTKMMLFGNHERDNQAQIQVAGVDIIRASQSVSAEQLLDHKTIHILYSGYYQITSFLPYLNDC